MQTLKYAVLYICAMAAAPSAYSSSGNSEDKLEWPVHGEILAYHSCGCADSCWVAEVHGARTKTVKARLRCDCEKLYFFRAGDEKERIVSESCSSINDSESKFDLIPRKMESLIRSKVEVEHQ